MATRIGRLSRSLRICVAIFCLSLFGCSDSTDSKSIVTASTGGDNRSGGRATNETVDPAEQRAAPTHPPLVRWHLIQQDSRVVNVDSGGTAAPPMGGTQVGAGGDNQVEANGGQRGEPGGRTSMDSIAGNADAIQGIMAGMASPPPPHGQCRYE